MTSAFERLAAEEDKFFRSVFLSPVVDGWPICVRLVGVVMTLATIGRRRTGWGVWRPASYKTARFVREPTLTERRAYLDLFPSLRLIACRKLGEVWCGALADLADPRFKITGLVPIRLAEEVQLFDTVIARFDGGVCWFDRPDDRQDPRTAGYLREQLTALAEPSSLDRSGLTPGAREAYAAAYGPALVADLEARRDKDEDRIKDALRRAGAEYRSYIDRGDTFTIEYTVGRETHRSVVTKDNLSVESAGICLSGNDRLFDLQSLATVIKEGQEDRVIVRVGNNQGERYGHYSYGPTSDQNGW